MMKRRNRLAALVAAALLVSALAACSAEPVQVPENAIIKDTPQLIGLRSYVSYTETQLTMTVTDAMRKAAQTDVSVIDARSFTDSEEDGVIAAGFVTREQLEKVLPGAGNVVTVRVRGSAIYNWAENNVKCILSQKNDNKPDDSYLHFSGIAFVFNKKNQEGSRIVENAMETPEEEQAQRVLGMDTEYTVAMPESTAGRLKLEVVRTVGGLTDILEAHLKAADGGISAKAVRMVDKADLDSPKIVTGVIIGVGVVAIAVIIIVYFVMKKKQKQARIKRGGEPRIDV